MPLPQDVLDLSGTDRRGNAIRLSFEVVQWAGGTPNAAWSANLEILEHPAVDGSRSRILSYTPKPQAFRAWASLPDHMAARAGAATAELMRGRIVSLRYVYQGRTENRRRVLVEQLEAQAIAGQLLPGASRSVVGLAAGLSVGGLAPSYGTSSGVLSVSGVLRFLEEPGDPSA